MPRRWLGCALVSALAAACSVYDVGLLSGNALPGETGDAGRDGGAGGLAGVGTMSGSVTTATTTASGTSTGVTGGSTGSTGGSSSATGGSGGAAGSGGLATGSTGSAGAGGTSGATGGSSMTGTAGRGSGSGGNAGGTGGAAVDAGGVVDAGCPTPTLCAVKAALIHRYSFTGSGKTVVDSVGNAHGTVVNGQLSGNGDVTFGDGLTQYVDLPNGIIKPLTNATLETWVRWDGGAGWQRLFDFGSSDGPENTQGFGVTTLYLTPHGAGPTAMLAALKRADQDPQFETRALSTQPLAANVMSHIVVVIDTTNKVMTLYRDGATDASVAFTGSLSALNDVNNWLGHSQYLNDPPFQGAIDEFRMYRAALSRAQVQASFAAGPDPAFLQ